jgi:hypothetical protein
MNRRKLFHVIAVGLLVGLLMVPGAALAQPAHHVRGPVDFWSWLAGFWGGGVSGLRLPSGLEQKQGLGIDPNGGTSVGQGGATGQSTPTGAISGPIEPERPTLQQ